MKTPKLWMLFGAAILAGGPAWFGWLAGGGTRNAQDPAVPPAARPPAAERAADAGVVAAAPAANPREDGLPLWREVDPRTAADKPPFADAWSQAGRALVDVSAAADAARTWREGDLVRIDVPQLGEPLKGRIDQIKHLGPAAAARGLAVDADGRSRRFVVTVGPGRVFAYIDTPAGPYELAGDGQLGWLLPTTSMLAGFDYSQPDYLIPEPPDAGGDAWTNSASAARPKR